MIQEQGLLVAQRMEWVKKLNNDIFEIRSKFQVIFKEHCTSMLWIIGMSLHMVLLKKYRKHQQRNIMGTINFNDLLQAELQDPSFKEGFKAEKAILESALALANARLKAGLTQRQLSELSHVPQSTIARIERGHNTSIETMSKLASALNQELTISIG